MPLTQFIIAILLHGKPFFDIIMQLSARRNTPRKLFAGVTVVVMCLISIGMGLAAGKIIPSIRDSRSFSETGTISILQVSTEGIVLVSSLLFSAISVMSSFFGDWSDTERALRPC